MSEIIENIKETITDNQHKIITDNLMKIHNNTSNNTIVVSRE